MNKTMKKLISAAATIALTVGIFSCTEDATSANNGKKPEKDTVVEDRDEFFVDEEEVKANLDTLRITWTLTSATGLNSDILALGPEDIEPYFQLVTQSDLVDGSGQLLEVDGAAELNDGCNSISGGDFYIEGNRIYFQGGFATTEMYCDAYSLMDYNIGDMIGYSWEVFINLDEATVILRNPLDANSNDIESLADELVFAIN